TARPRSAASPTGPRWLMSRGTSSSRDWVEHRPLRLLGIDEGHPRRATPVAGLEPDLTSNLAHESTLAFSGGSSCALHPVRGKCRVSTAIEARRRNEVVGRLERTLVSRAAADPRRRHPASPAAAVCER